MFATLSPPEPDKILKIMEIFARDPRPDKVDLGVGVYRDPAGKTPVMAAVKAAETRIWESQETKSYTGLRGDTAYLEAISGLILGQAVTADRVAACGTPGGTGAVRQVLEMTRRLTPGATVWLPDPTWPNHPAIVDHLEQRRRTYRYYDRETGGLDRAGMWADLAQARAGDVILVHGCCHNPTGADLQAADWRDLAALCQRTGAIPFVDIAYLGFAEGPAADAAGVRHLAKSLPEILVAASCSKNFGLYRDRVGVVLAVVEGPGPQAAAAGTLANLNRQNYAFPPDHGARVVETILNDPPLRSDWERELAQMRGFIQANRRALADALRDATGSDRFGFLAGQNGMFSLSGATPAQVARLREDHGIYLIDDGRMNLAGLTPATIPTVATAMARVLE
jgi:aromatic-amino-acid transaminase